MILSSLPAASGRTTSWGEAIDSEGAMAAAMTEVASDLAILQDKAGEASRLLRLLANENRLILLCELAGSGEMAVGALAAAVGLSQPALSQHLARLREDGLVGTRRKAQTVFYRIADPKAARVLALLRELYCPAVPDRP